MKITPLMNSIVFHINNTLRPLRLGIGIPFHGSVIIRIAIRERHLDVLFKFNGIVLLNMNMFNPLLIHWAATSAFSLFQLCKFISN